MKTILYIVLILVIIALGLATYYFLWYKPAAPTTGQGGNPPPTAGNAPKEQPPSYSQVTPTSTPQAAKFGVVAPNQTINYFVDQQNNAYLVQPDGQIVKISAGGQAATLSSSQINKLTGADFSYDGQKIIVTFGGDQQNPQSSIFDIASRSWQPLPPGLISTVWSPSSYNIAYLTQKNDVATLYMLDASSTKAKPQQLLSLHAQDLLLKWSSPNQILLSQKSSALVNSSVWSFDVKKRTLSLIIDDQLGLDSIWSAGGQEALVFNSGFGKRGGSLELTNNKGETLHNLTFLTLPSKCVFAPAAAEGSSTPPSTLYCAIPRDVQKLKLANLPDDYEKMAIFTTDDFYSVDLNSGDMTAVFNDQNQNLDASSLKIFNQTLFFINRYDQKIYAISLK